MPASPRQRSRETRSRAAHPSVVPLRPRRSRRGEAEGPGDIHPGRGAAEVNASRARPISSPASGATRAETRYWTNPIVRCRPRRVAIGVVRSETRDREGGRAQDVRLCSARLLEDRRRVAGAREHHSAVPEAQAGTASGTDRSDCLEAARPCIHASPTHVDTCTGAFGGLVLADIEHRSCPVSAYVPRGLQSRCVTAIGSLSFREIALLPFHTTTSTK
jgi:hypothetical protein